MSFLHGSHMLAPGFPTLRQSPRANGFRDLLYLLVRKKDLRLALDIGHVALIQNVGRQGCFELAVPPKHHDGEEAGVVNAEKLRERSGMAIVLSQGVLKAVLVPIQVLRPLRVVFFPEDPAIYVFGFDHENAIARDKNMIDLRGSIARGKSCVVETDIGAGIEEQFLSQSSLKLADPPFHHRF